MKILIVSVFCFVFNSISAQTIGYKVMPMSKLNRILFAKEKIECDFFNDSYNKLITRIYKDSTAAVISPNLAETEGIYFYNLDAYRKMTASRKYPVKSSGTVWSLEKEHLQNLSAMVPVYCTLLSKKLNFDVKISFDSLYLYNLGNKLSTKIHPYKFDILMIYTSIYLAELCRRKLGYSWILEKEFGFNTYYYPRIYHHNTVYDIIDYITERLYFGEFNLYNIYKSVDSSKLFTNKIVTFNDYIINK